MKKILVTGGVGFLGSFICDQSLAQDHEVIALNNYFSRSKKYLTFTN